MCFAQMYAAKPLKTGNSKLMDMGKLSTWLDHGGDIYLDLLSCIL